MRPSNSPFDSISLQERDLALLRGLFESRIMTARHMTVLYFGGKAEAVKKRLQKLKAVGLIGERRRKAYEPAILFLTRKAFVLLREEGILSQYPRLDPTALERRARVSDLTLRHELEIMDVKAAFYAALAGSPQLSLAEFSTWPLLYQFEAFRSGYGKPEVLVKPDGFIRIEENEPDGGRSEHSFFLEVDRSSETQETLINRVGCYLDYYRSGGFAVRNGGTPAEFKDYPFRVLIVFKSAERRNNTAKRLMQHNPPILELGWLSTLEEVTANSLGAIWIRPRDYCNATLSTAFTPASQSSKWDYKRQSAREELVEQHVEKKVLFE